VSTGAVDDGQTPMAESDTRVIMKAITVWSTMRDGKIHRTNGSARVRREWTVEGKRPGNTAHAEDCIGSRLPAPGSRRPAPGARRPAPGARPPAPGSRRQYAV
jgi:hypothetical protein